VAAAGEEEEERFLRDRSDASQDKYTAQELEQAQTVQMKSAVQIALATGMLFAHCCSTANAQSAPPVRLAIQHSAPMVNPRIAVGEARDNGGGAIHPAAWFMCEQGRVCLSDGTFEGTRSVEDIYTASDIAPIPDGVGAYFICAAPFPDGNQLCYTDGTQAGTHELTDLVPLFPEGMRKIFGFIQGRVIIGTATDRVVVTDGTPGGTETVLPAASGIATFQISIGITQGFVYRVDATGNSLWRIGLTAADTRDLTPKVQPFFFSRGVAAVGDSACFQAGENEVGGQLEVGLYCTDGTVEGTALMATDADGWELGVRDPSQFQRFGSQLFFVARAAPPGTTGEVYVLPWVTDGTQAGTYRLGWEYVPEYSFIGTTDGHVYFSGYPAAQTELWKTDGTMQGTRLISSEPWSVAGRSPENEGLNPVYAGTTFFVSSGADGWRVQRTNGTVDGTYQLAVPPSEADHWQASSDVTPGIVGTHLLVEAWGSFDAEIWAYDLDPIFGSGFDP
jgi:ELWxxDGT repeat protein